MKFKVGDLVTCIDDSEMRYLENGQSYKVVEVVERHDVTYLKVEIKGIIHGGFYYQRFKHAIPNNKLSRIVYPELEPSECGEYLCSTK